MRARAVIALLAGTTMAGAGAIAAPTAFAAPAKPSGPEQHVIVLLRDQHPESPALAGSVARRAAAVRSDQAPLQRSISRLGGSTTHAFTTLNAVAATLPTTSVATLRADPAVADVVPDLVWKAPRPAHESAQAGTSSQAAGSQQVCPSSPAHPLLEPEALQLTHTNSDSPTELTARSLGYDGRGVKVAFIADGVDVNQPDFIRADGSHVFVDYQDFSGDGTAAPTSGAEALGDAGSIAAQGRQAYDLSTFVNPAHPLPAGCTIRVEGMAPGASLVGLKVFSNALLTAPTSTIIQAIDWAVSHDHVDVLNESFGSNPYPDTAADPISMFNRDAVDAGVTVTASTGDAGGGNSLGTASTDPWVIGVAGSTQFRAYVQEGYGGAPLGNGHWVSDQLSSLSSGGIGQTGRVPDLMAPGDLGWSTCSNATLPNGDPQYVDCTDENGRPSDLQLFGGTSESAPLTAGAAALVIQAYRQAHHGQSPSPDQVRRVLDSSADDLGLPAQDQGAGRLNSYRAVQAAVSLAGGRATGQGLVFDRAQVSRTTTPGALVTSKVRVTNTGVGPQRVTAALRRIDKVVGQQTKTVAIDSSSTQTFLDQLGRQRVYVTTSVKVPVGTDLLRASIAWPGPAGPLVRMTLFDPQGALTAYTLPQGTGNLGSVEVHNPAPGTWKAVLWTAPGAAGFTGPVSLRTTDLVATSAGTVSPSSFTLPQGGTRLVTVITRAPRSGARADSIVLTGRFGQQSTLPVVVQAVQPVTKKRAATFSGTFEQANGRDFSPGQTDTYRFAVPAGARDLDVNLRLTGTPANEIVAHLSDPSGEPVDTLLNTDPTTYDPSKPNPVISNGLQIIHANPAAGVWQLTLELANPVAGAALPQAYRGSVALDQARVSSSGVPTSVKSKVSKAKGATATIRVVNTSPAPQTFFVDARTASTVTYPLVAKQAATKTDPYTASVALPLPDENVPAWLVPTESTRVTVGASSTAPETFDLMPLDNPTAINAPSSPDIEANVSGNSATAVHTARPVASALWAAFPSLIGPFPPNGATPGSVSMQASVVTRQFDRAVTSSTGDPLLGTVYANAPAATPVTLAPGASVTLKVTIKPTAGVGSQVRGTLFVDVLQPGGAAGLSSYADAIAALPYAYTVKK